MHGPYLDHNRNKTTIKAIYETAGRTEHELSHRRLLMNDNEFSKTGIGVVLF